MLALMFTTLALLLVVSLNWRRFDSMGWGSVLRLLLIWTAIFAGGALFLRLAGLA